MVNASCINCEKCHRAIHEELWSKCIVVASNESGRKRGIEILWWLRVKNKIITETHKLFIIIKLDIFIDVINYLSVYTSL